MEEKKSPQEVILEFIKKNILFVGLLLLGVVLLFIGVFQYFASKSNSSDLEFTSSTSPHADAVGQDVKGGSDSLKKISVDVEGKVQKPGVYLLSDGARIQDALIASGGLSSAADRVYVSKHLNLAQKVIDGGKIYIPGVGEAGSADGIGSNTNQSNGGANSMAETGNTDVASLININSASAGQLDTLQKVGPATAQKIISGRPYSAIEEMVSKKVLGQKTFDGLKDKRVAE